MTLTQQRRDTANPLIALADLREHPEVFHSGIFRDIPAVRQATDAVGVQTTPTGAESFVSRRAMLSIAAAALAGTGLAATVTAPQTVSPELLALIETHRKAHDALHRAIDREDDESIDRVAYERDYTVANDAEEDAITAVCAYVCQTERDGPMKAEYLARYAERMHGLQSWHVDALLQSIAGGSDA